jgi:hypothetical protein
MQFYEEASPKLNKFLYVDYIFGTYCPVIQILQKFLQNTTN